MVTDPSQPVLSECVAQAAPGRPDAMVLDRLEVPAPGAGQVRLRVEACGLNPVDWKIATTGLPGWTWPHVGGLDIVGQVEAVGSTGDESLLGTRVAVHHAMTRQGGLSQFALVDVLACCAVPAGLPPTVAAAVPCPGLTAAQAVDRTHVAAEERTLVIGAGGAVGTFATQLAVQAGADVTAVAAPADSERLHALGATTVVDYHDGPLTEIVPGPFDVVLDLVGQGDAQAATLLAYCGRLASVARPDLSAVPPFSIAPTASEIALGAIYATGTAADLRRMAARLAELLDLVAAGTLVTAPLVVGQLADAPALLQAMADGSLAGKVVLEVAG